MLDENAMFTPLGPDEETGPPAASGRSGKVPIVPVPDNAPAMRFKHPELEEPTKIWPYHDAGGHLIGYVARWDFIGADGQPTKEILPITYCDLGGGRWGWRAKGMPSPRPLFGLPEILKRTTAPIMISEGEKARDAAAILFPDMVVTTPAQGAKSPQLTDFSSCAGREVVIAPDYDAPGRIDVKGKPMHPGRDFGDTVFQLCHRAGAASIRRLPPERLAIFSFVNGIQVLRNGPIPDGWDLADALAEGWTAERIAELRNDPDYFSEYVDFDRRHDGGNIHEPSTEAGCRYVNGCFRILSDRVELRIEKEDKRSGEKTVEWRSFCSRLVIEADVRSPESNEWGRLLAITDRDGVVKRWVMPNSLMASEGMPYLEPLLSLGLILAPGKRRWIREALDQYIASSHPERRARCVGRIGWHGKAMVMPDWIAAAPGAEDYLLQTGGPVDHAFRMKGDLESWQQNVARYAIGNSRLVLAISIAFAGPLLYPTMSESGGINFRGGSSIGKTTTLWLAGSVWGGGGVNGFIRTWRTTANALEGIAAMSSDTLLCLDEMGQVDGKEAGQAAYMLANGQGKSRADRYGAARPTAEWRIMFMSTSEQSLADKIAECGRRVAAGQEVRVLDLPADAGAGFGIFENLHGFSSGDALARHLKTATGEHYGTASRIYLQHLAKVFDDLAPAVLTVRDQFVAECCPPGADGQVSRVAARFGLIAAAGELATELGILPWPAGEARRAAERCFHAWMAERGGVGAAEDRAALAAVRRFIEAHGSSRFELMGELAPKDADGQVIEQKIFNRVGFKRLGRTGGTEFIFLTETWKKEVCVGLDPSAVTKVLRTRGLLLLGGDGRPQKQERLPGFDKPVRCYVVTDDILSEDV